MRAQVMRAHEVVEGTIARLRDAMIALHPVTVEQGGFEVALGAVGRAAGRQGGFELEVGLDPTALGIEDELLLAVARELLTNAARHADAEHVRVTLRNDNGWLELDVADNGHGMPSGRREAALGEGHIGLASVSQRLHSRGGSLAIDSSESGTRATARMPLDPAG